MCVFCPLPKPTVALVWSMVPATVALTWSMVPVGSQKGTNASAGRLRLRELGQSVFMDSATLNESVVGRFNGALVLPPRSARGRGHPILPHDPVSTPSL